MFSFYCILELEVTFLHSQTCLTPGEQIIIYYFKLLFRNFWYSTPDDFFMYILGAWIVFICVVLQTCHRYWSHEGEWAGHSEWLIMWSLKTFCKADTELHSVWAVAPLAERTHSPFLLSLTFSNKKCARICLLYHSEIIVSENKVGLIIIVAL